MGVDPTLVELTADVVSNNLRKYIQSVVLTANVFQSL